MTDGKDLSNRLHYAKRVSSEEARSMSNKPLQPNKFGLFSRSLTALTRHRVHELSDIREVSCSSRTTALGDKASQPVDIRVEGPSNTMQTSLDKHVGPRSDAPPSEYTTPAYHTERLLHHRRGSRATSAMSLPLQEIPERRSSISLLSRSIAGSRHASIHDLPLGKTTRDSFHPPQITRTGRAVSPVRHAVSRGAQNSDMSRTSPSCTFIRTSPPLEILENGVGCHSRLDLSVRLPSPLFVGGGTIEGQIELSVDSTTNKKASLPPLLISRLSVDVIGVEEVGENKRHIFLSLASELFDKQHPPPPTLVTSQQPMKSSELFWETRPGQAVVPFCINLPLKLGPPPYLSKHATIRYLLSPTAVIKIGEKRTVVRQIWNVQIFTVHDPEKALGSLATPLLATDTLVISQNPSQAVKLTAGLHRQTWVNGGPLFADVHVVNNTSKSLKKIELQLEKTTLWYVHAAAGTTDKSASHLRLPKRNETETVCVATIKKSREWKGIGSQSSEVRTCEIEIPRGHVTISSGRYFEVRYFINVIVSINLFKSIAVQLPITIIPISSLDILPNALAQVAASIEAKRAKILPTRMDDQMDMKYRQGQAFTAPRRQSVDKGKADKGQTGSCGMDSLMHDLDNSPRRMGQCPTQLFSQSDTVGLTKSDENREFIHPSLVSHHHHRRHPSCYHCHLIYSESARPRSSDLYAGPRLPRLQVSTSGLGFSESEFEVPADSPPRKVMLSEHERTMIRQQRELKLQRRPSAQNACEESLIGENKVSDAAATFLGWKNVAVMPYAQAKTLDFGVRDKSAPGRRYSRRSQGNVPRFSGPNATGDRTGSKTNPEGFRSIGGEYNMGRLDIANSNDSRHKIRSMDRGSRFPQAVDLMDDGAVFGHPKAASTTLRPQSLFMHGASID